jgi:hypothetical protein
LAKRQAGVLAALVGMMDHRLRLTCHDRHVLDLPPNDVHFFGLKKGYVQIITSGLSSVLACGQRGAP